jgi:SAM-dependent methyltransferase
LIFSQAHQNAIEKGKEFHLENPTWSGTDSKHYLKYTKKLAKYYNIKNILDYGCGKGLQYEKGYMDKIGIEDAYLYDPCVSKYNKFPPKGAKFDAILCMQVIKHIPDEDLPALKQFFEQTATKFVLIADVDPSVPSKKKKQLIQDWRNRDNAFYKSMFADTWSSSAKLYFAWHQPMDTKAREDNLKIQEIRV